MSRYQLFQQWWAKATSGPSDFRINKRSAEIGFNAALDLSEQNSDSPATPVQQRYYAIKAICERTDPHETDIDVLRSAVNKIYAALTTQ